MPGGDTEILTALRNLLVERVGKDRFALWFRAAEHIDLVDDTIVVTAPNQFSVDLLRKRFRRELVEVGQEVLGKSPKLEFRIETTTPASTIQVDRQEPPRDPAPMRKKRPRRPAARLESFVVGDGSRVAYTAAQEVLKRPGQVTPLFVYGPTGCGKTHLLESIASGMRRARKQRSVVYVSAEQFTSHFLEALHGRGLPSFRRKYRGVHVLLIDDVQFFAGKRATLVELQHTLDALLTEGRQLVLSADRSPAELNGMGRELSARMSGGLVCGIESADMATRLGIARRLAKSRQIAVPNDVLKLLAAELPGDARQISGALNRLSATSQALDKPLTRQLAESALADLFRATHRIVRICDVESAICEVFGLESKTLRSSRRTNSVSQPRMLAMWLARKYTRAAYSEIGEYFGRRSHSTVISAQNKVNAWMGSGAEIQLAHGPCHVEDAIRRVESRLRTG